MQKTLSLKIVIALSILIVFSFKTTFACQGSVPPACAAFSQARNVFTGKLIKIEKTDTDEFSGTNLYFEVIKTYKGEPNSVQIVPYSESDCGITFVEGESYLVYKKRYSIWAYDRVLPLKASNDDIEYINGLSKENPQFIISGQLQAYPDEQLKDVKMFVEEGNNKYEVEFQEFYRFSFKTRKPGKYKLKIIIPFDAYLFHGDYSEFFTPELYYSSNQTIAETEFEFEPNSCVYVEYTIEETVYKKQPPWLEKLKMIRVLESTLQDVENIFGKPDRKDYLIAHYLNLEEGNLIIDFSNGNCPSMLNLGWNVPNETVVRILFRPKEKKNFPELGIDQTKLQRTSSEIYNVFVNKDEGVTYETGFGSVQSIEYKPTSRQNHLKCFIPEK